MKNAWVVATTVVSDIEACIKSGLIGTDAAGLSLPEVAVLYVLYQQDGQNPKHLARAIGKAATSFTPIIDGLQDRSLVTRSPDPHDRRAIVVNLTEKGQGLRCAIDEAVAAAGGAFDGYEIKVE